MLLTTNLHLQPGDALEIDRETNGRQGWILIGEFTIFGSNEQLNAITDRLVALRPVAEDA